MSMSSMRFGFIAPEPNGRGGEAGIRDSGAVARSSRPPRPRRRCHHKRARARDRQHTRHAHANPPFLGLLKFGAKTSRARARKCTTLPRRRARFNPTLLLVEFRRAHPQYFAALLKALAPVPPTLGFGRRARVFITPGCSWLPRRRRRPLLARRARSIRTELNAPATQK